MEKEFENIDDLLGKYLAGEATEHERLLVTEWIGHDEENRKYFDQVRTVFDKAAAIKDFPQFDTDAAWNKVKANLHYDTPRIVPINGNRSSYAWWYSAAAVVIVLFGVAWYLFLGGTGKDVHAPVVLVAETQAVGDTLPHGTSVFLNKHTRLAYTFDRKHKKHEVKLEGEAYFNVQKTADEDLIIDASGVYIRDIGTSFNVRAYPGSDEVEVLVEEGEVRFFTADNPGISLKASGKGVYNRKTRTFAIENPEPNITAYKTRFFIFSGEDLKTIAAALNEVYDKQLVVPPSLENCMITVSFREESIEEIAAVISETLGLQWNEVDNQIVLSGEGCR